VPFYTGYSTMRRGVDRTTKIGNDQLQFVVTMGHPGCNFWRFSKALGTGNRGYLVVWALDNWRSSSIEVLNGQCRLGCLAVCPTLFCSLRTAKQTSHSANIALLPLLRSSLLSPIARFVPSFKMIIPVRCFTCGKVIGNKWETYLSLLQADYSEG
jgi:RNA polymerases N / 8 kDa subunit